MNTKFLFKGVIINCVLVLLSGCETTSLLHEGLKPYRPEHYKQLDYQDSEEEALVYHSLPSVVEATYGYGNDPAVMKAYEQFVKEGVAKTIHTKGFDTFAYDAHFQPIVECAPLHLCTVQLEHGEQINDINIGDSADWLVNTSLIGSPKEGSYQINIKPKLANIATEMVIATNKRTYNIGLVSKKAAKTHVIAFYYPRETLYKSLHMAQTFHPLLSPTPGNNTVVDVNQLHFNYSLEGDKPSWCPRQVFDDGHKTFIQMPAITEQTDLPVLYINQDNQKQLVNYRYRRPYFVVDGLFEHAYLLTGTGHHQKRVIINNHHFY